MKLTIELDEEDVEEVIQLMHRVIEAVDKLENYQETGIKEIEDE
jgi:Asp-tRNA(Asn)/Glu-tRNA(Gln) amidotransferase C subunit